jgi:hypothetical protein
MSATNGRSGVKKIESQLLPIMNTLRNMVFSLTAVVL